MQSRKLGYASIVVGWALLSTWVELRIVPWQWPPEVDWLRIVDYPGVFVMVAMGAVHGFRYAWINDGIIILGSTAFWSLLTMLAMWCWSAIRRGSRPAASR